MYFNPKLLKFFLLLHENMYCMLCYSLEASQRNTSNEDPEGMSLRKIKKKYLLDSSFYLKLYFFIKK